MHFPPTHILTILTGRCNGWSRQCTHVLLRRRPLLLCRSRIAVSLHFLLGLKALRLCPPRGEMAAYIPISGTFAVFARRFVSPSMGFTLGWNYWLQW